MDHPLHLTPAVMPLLPAAPDARRTPDPAIAPVTPAQPPAPLPPERPFVAQAVAARLQSTGFAETPAEIQPAERVLRPYGVPMLPADKPETTAAAPSNTQIEKDNS